MWKFLKYSESMNEDYYLYINKFFEKWAPVYNFTDLFISGVRWKTVNFTDAKIGSRVLDVCTGTGKQAFAFARKGYDVTGIDLSENMLKVAKKNNTYKNVRFEAADAANMPFDSSSFDISCISFALHEMPLTIREKVLNEIVRVTKPKGTIIIVDYALPINKISRFLVYHFVKLYESKYYPEFINSEPETLLRKLGIKTKEVLPVLHGVGKILKVVNKKNRR